MRERMAESIGHRKGDERRMEMHVINAWLPPPVFEQTKREAEAFASVVRSVLDSWRPDDSDSVFSTLKWISIIDTRLPAHVTLLARFVSEPSPIKTTVTRAVAEFRRTHADTWIIQKNLFTDEQPEVLADTSSSASYFA